MRLSISGSTLERRVLSGLLGFLVMGTFWYLMRAGGTRTLGAYATSLSGRSPEQIANISRAARLVDGVKILPGQEFSLNKALGSQSFREGWEEAEVIVNGEVKKAAGGGVCQLASTLYNAILLADLPVTERHAHSRPVSSVPPGRDAAIALGIADLRFKNNRSTPVTLSVGVLGKLLSVEMKGPGKLPGNVTIETSTAASGVNLKATVWKKTEGSSGRELVSEDTYRAALPSAKRALPENQRHNSSAR